MGVMVLCRHTVATSIIITAVALMGVVVCLPYPSNHTTTTVAAAEPDLSNAEDWSIGPD